MTYRDSTSIYLCSLFNQCTPFMGFQVKTQRCCLLSICNVIIVRDFRDSTVLKLNLCIVGINYMEHMCFFAILLVLLAFPISMDRMHMNLARLFSLESFFKLFSDNVLLHSNPAVASSQIDEWLEYAPVFSLGPAFDKIYVMVVVGAANEPHFESEAEKFVKYIMTCR